MTCCDRPSPRILAKNGRMFCGNCRRYLDEVARPEPPTLPQAPTDSERKSPEAKAK